MNIFQVILSCAILFIGLYSFLNLRKGPIDTFIILILGSTGLTFVAYPEITNDLANVMGINRGADMIFYAAVLFFTFVLLKLYSSVRKTKEDITNIIRSLSLKESEYLGALKENKNDEKTS